LDNDAREKPDDVLALAVGESGVEAGPKLAEKVVDLLGHRIAHSGLCGGQAGFQGDALGLDAV
jgi:hypothetical protein